MMSDDTEGMHYVPVLVLKSETTPKQRIRNRDQYQRLRDGAPGIRGGSDGLSGFVYEVPMERMSIAPDGRTFSFRLDKSDECFRRLLNVIADHFPTSCDADDEVDRLLERLEDVMGDHL